MTNSKILNILRLVAGVAFLALVSVVVLAGCGETQLKGSWTLDRVVTKDTTINSNTADKGEYGDDFNNVLTFNEDGSGTVKIRSETATTSAWTQDGSKVTITVGSDDTTYTLEGTELILEQDGVKYFYKKSTQQTD